MKILFCAAAFLFLLLTGCEKMPAEIAPEELFEVTGGVTANGIQAGDGREQFISAYSDYTIQVAYDNPGSSYLIMDINKIPYQEDISAIIANFFIDGQPVSERELCTENNVEPTQLYALLSSSSYLHEHDVLYRYLRFEWSDGKIVSIEPGELNYNETYETPRLR